MDRFRKRDDNDEQKKPPTRQPSRDAKPEQDDSGGRRFPFSGRGDKEKDKDAGKESGGGRRFPVGARGGDDKNAKSEKSDPGGGRLGALSGMVRRDDKDDKGDRGKRPASSGRSSASPDDDKKSGGLTGRFSSPFGKKDKEDEKPAAPQRGPFTGSDSGAGSRAPGSTGGSPFGERRASSGASSRGLPGSSRPGGDRPAGGGLPGARPGGLGGDRPAGGGLPGARPGGLGGDRPGGGLPGARPGGGSPPGSRPGVPGGSVRPRPYDADDDDESPGGSRSPLSAGGPPRGGSAPRPGLPGGAGAGSRSPFLTGDDEDDDEDEGARPARPGGGLPGARPAGLGGDRPAGGGLPGARPGGLGGDRPAGGGLPGARPGGLGGDRPGGDRPAGGGLPGARPAGLGGDRPGGGSPPGSRPGGLGGDRPAGGGLPGARPGGLGGDRPGGASSPGSRPGGGLPGARPAGLGGDRPGGGGLPGSRPGGAGAPGGPSRSSPFTAPSGGDSGDKGKDGKSKSKGKGKDGKDKAQGDGLKGKLPFFGGKGKDKGDKGKSGDKPARPAGVADRGSSARPATALPGAASGRAAAPSASRPSTASRSRTQAKALPDARQAPRIVNRGLDLDRKLDLIGVALVVLGGIMLFGILPSMSFGLLPPVEGGLTGTIDHFLSQLFGWGKIVWPVLCFGVGIWLMLRYFGGQMFDIDYFRVVGTLVLYAGALAWLHMLQLVDDVAPTVEAFKPISYDLAVKTGEGGGWFGHQIYFFLLSQLGDWGTLVLLIGWLVLGVMLTFNVSAIQIGQFVVGAFMFLRTRGNRNQRRLAQEVAQAETVTVARPGAPQAVPARSSPRQIPLTPATVTGTGAGQASGGSGGPSVASQEPPERPRPLIRRRGDEETTSSEDAAVSAAEAPVATAAAALASGVVAASAPGEKDKQPAEEAGRSRFRMPSLRGKPSAAEEPAQASDEKRAAPPVADEKTAEQESGSRLGRFGGLLKRGGSEPEAEQASGGGGRRGRQRDKDAAGKDADKADRKGEEKDEQPSRPSMARPLAAAAAGAAAGAALAFSRPDRRADEKALDALDVEDEDDDETGEEIAAPAETTPAPSPARSPFAPPRPGMGPSPLQRASFDDDDEDEDDEIDLEDEDEIEEGEDEVAASGAPERTPIRSGIPVPPRDSRPLPGAPTAPAAPAAAASVPTPDDAPAASGDGDQAEGESYRPFSRPLPGRRIPPFDPARGAGNPSPQPGEAPAARVTPPDETNNDAGDEIPAPADEQPPVRDRAQALGLPPRPGMPPRRVPPVVESPVVVADETDDEDAPPARAPLSAAPLIGIKPDAASPRLGLTHEPPSRVSPFAAPDLDADADEDDDEATTPADEAIDLDALDDEDDGDDVTTPAEEPRARPAFMSGDARPQGAFPRRPMPGSVAPVRPPLPARPGAVSDSDDDAEDDDQTAPAASAGAGQPPERGFSGVPLRSGVTPAADEMSTNGSGDSPAETIAPPEPETPAAQEQPAASVIDAPMVHSMIEALAATPDDTVRAEPEAAALSDDDPEEEAPAVAPVAHPQAAADIQPQRVPSRPLPTETPPAPRREDVASVASAVASRPADLTRRDAVSLGALRDKDEDRPQPPTRTGPQKPHWEVPDFRDLLKKGSEQRVDDEILLDKARMIEDTLASFGAPGKVVEVNPGPVITQFGVEPDYLVNRSGKRTRVKVSSIARLDADLALALAARSIRVEAPVPGKGFVGIEVPNDKITAVNLYDVMDSPEFRRINSKLRIALGLSVDGTPVAADLTVMPHLLIAGTTGSGKSVCVNAIINCLLLSNAPEDLQFIMVDPKRVELTGYNGIPHLLSPVVVDLERVVGVLQWVQREMDDRYRRFAAVGARNIVDYNGKLRPEEKRMPYIIVVIDELADLMMLAPDETEKLLARLAQMARATGIHLIISTQRPSVDVVTGLIKANFPARIAFAVASMMDSRVILDQPGAEKLLGRGDMLYQSPDAPAPLRMQGVYVSDEEINNATRYWKTQGLNKSEPQEDGLVSFPKTNGNGRSASRPAMRADPGQQQAFWDDSNQPTFEVEDDEIGDGRDEMYDEAVELVKRLNKASISLLQRRLRIGYTRAARLIDIMENEGIVGPAESGSKPREVLKRD